MGNIGGVAGLPYLAFVGGIAVIFFFFAKKLRGSRGFTLPDYMGDRFGSNFLRGFCAVRVAVLSIIYLIGQIRVMGFILERLLDIPFFWGMLVGTVIFVFYVAVGGLLAVVWTNIVQFVFMWLGLLLMGPYVFAKVGGWYDVIDKVEALAPGWTSPQGTTWSFSFLVSWYIIWFVAYCTRLELITKMYAARDDKVARRSLPWTILLVMIFLLYGNFYIGGAARILVWDSISTAARDFMAAIEALPFQPDGPLWYRGNSLENERVERDRVDMVLQHLNARAMMVGHTVTRTGRVNTRFNGRVYRGDVGMGYGRPGFALVIRGDDATMFDPAGSSSTLVAESPHGEGWARGYEHLPDHVLEDFLREAEVAERESIERDGQRAEICEMKGEGMSLRAVFKDVEGGASDDAGPVDRYQHDDVVHRGQARISLEPQRSRRGLP